MQINLHKEMSHLDLEVDPFLHKDLIDHAACDQRPAGLLRGMCFAGPMGFFGTSKSHQTPVKSAISSSGKLTQLWKITIFEGKTHYTYP